MPRRRTHHDAVRNRLISFRLTQVEYDRLQLQASSTGTTVSGLSERLVTRGRVVVADTSSMLDPHVLGELRRIGNNLNQIAHALNSNLPPQIPFAATQMHDLVVLLTKHHYFVARTQEARAMEKADDTSPPEARDEFQRSAQLRSP